MTESLTFDMSGDSRSAEAAFKKLIKENDRLRKEFQELGNTSQKVEKQGKAMGDSLVESLASAALGAVSLQAAYRLVVVELDNVIQRQKQAANTVISTADAKLGFLRNLGDATDTERAWHDSKIMDIAARTKQLPAAVYQAAGEASAAKGSLTYDEMYANVEMGFRVAPESLEEATATAGGLGDTSKLTESGDARINMAMILAAGNQARVATLRQVSQNLVPGAIGTKGYGGSSEEAMAFVTTLTNQMNDTTGAVSKTAAITIAQQLDKLRGEELSPAEHIAALQQDPAALDEFMKKASMPIEAQIPFRKIATGGTSAAELFEENKKGFAATPEEGAAMTDRFVSALERDPVLRVAGMQRAFEAAAKQMELNDLQGAATSVNADGLATALNASGASWTQQSFQLAEYRAHTMLGMMSPEEAATHQLTARMNQIRGVDSETERVRERARTDEQEALATQLETLIKEIQGMRIDQKKANGTKPRVVNADAFRENK